MAQEKEEPGSSVVEMGRIRSSSRSPDYADLDVVDAFSENFRPQGVLHPGAADDGHHGHHLHVSLRGAAQQVGAVQPLVHLCAFPSPVRPDHQPGLLRGAPAPPPPQLHPARTLYGAGGAAAGSRVRVLRGGSGAVGAGSHGLRQLRPVPVRPADQVGLHCGPGLPVGSGAGSPRLRDHRRHRPDPVAQDLVHIFWDPDLCNACPPRTMSLPPSTSTWTSSPSSC
ncbi:uncharacterized protein LOC119921319 isoform X4 [Tachyglossus aculeatus]|uniref:uncharacterized protein LOC119921319 isoform X4 n=1 Tax=Tachyglossus aculeatus TaxID=9261 RepID=UPI0018F74346|nr:uncharacterized protein LOC119921319 isoform X4 [Tachyglossus aculeatus]